MRIRYIIFSMMLLLTVTAFAKGRDEVIVTRQITADERHLIPDKTLSLTVKRASFSRRGNTYLTHAILSLADSIADNDISNRVFELIIEPKIGHTDIAIRSTQLFDNPNVSNSDYYGVLHHRHIYLLLRLTPANKPLLKENLDLRGGKLSLIQEFEMVEYKAPYEPTTVMATVNDAGATTISMLQINLKQDNDGNEQQTD